MAEPDFAAAGPTAIGPGRCEASPGAIARSGARIGLPAILFFPAGGFSSVMLPFTLGAIVAMAIAALTLLRLVGDRTILRYDADTLTVHGLLGKATLRWCDVAEITASRAGRFDARAMLASGSRRNLVVSCRRDRLGGPARLYIPIALLGLDARALARLVTRFEMLAVVAPADRSPRADPADVFDADAIIARHLAARAAPVSRRATFGCKTA